jgi:hemoglobin-like flavoprotein
MSFDQSLLRDNFELVLQRDQAFPRRFYEILFERWPQARSLFIRNSEGAQNAMLAQTLMAVLDHLEDDAWLDGKLVPLGMQHAQYGVTPQMYDWVGEALISAVAEVSAEDWTAAHQAAWKAAYGKISQIMCRVDATAVPVA